MLAWVAVCVYALRIASGQDFALYKYFIIKSSRAQLVRLILVEEMCFPSDLQSIDCYSISNV